MTDPFEGAAPAPPLSPALRIPTLLLSAIAAALLFGMAALTFVDVMGRYVFNAPVPGAFEIIEFMLALLIFAGLPLVTLDNGHITVGVLDHWFGRVAIEVKQVVIFTTSAAALGFIAERMYSQAVGMTESQRVTGFLELETAPAVFAMSLLAAVTCAIQIWMALRAAAAIRFTP